MMPATPSSLASLIEYQLLKPDVTRQDIERACAEARQRHFHSLCVNGSRVLQVAARLDESEVKVATVVGFPLGAMDSDAKRYETEVAIDNGTQEINLFLNHGWLKDGEDSALLREIRDVIEAADERPVAVMLEIPLLTPEEKLRAWELIKESGAKAVVVGTDCQHKGVTIEEIKSLREKLGPKFLLTAAGITNGQLALDLTNAGATRIATPTPGALQP